MKSRTSICSQTRLIASASSGGRGGFLLLITASHAATNTDSMSLSVSGCRLSRMTCNSRHV